MAKPLFARLNMFYGGPDTDNLPLRSTIIDRTDVFVSKGRGWQNQEQEYRQAGYTGLITIYQLFLQIQRTPHPTLNWNHNQWVTSQAEFNALPASAFLRKGSINGARIEYSPGTYGTSTNIEFVWIDPASPDVRNWMKARAENLLGKYGQYADGIFLDNISWGLKQVKDDAGGQTVYSNYKGEAYTETTWAQANADLCNWLKTNISHPLNKQWALGGNLIHQTSTTDWTKYSGLDYILDESIAGYPQVNSEWSASRIKHTIEQARKFLALNSSKFVMLIGQANDTDGGAQSYANDLQRMRMTLGEYAMIRPISNDISLLGRQFSRVTYRWTEYNRYGQWWEYPEYDTNLGAPIGDAFEEQPGLWRRQYERGYVRANFNYSATGGLAARDAEFIVTGSSGGGGTTPPPATTPSLTLYGTPVAVDGATLTSPASISPTSPAGTVGGSPIYCFLEVRNNGTEAGKKIDVTPVAAWNQVGLVHADYTATMYLFQLLNPAPGSISYQFNFETGQTPDATAYIFQPSNVDHASVGFSGQYNSTASTSASSPGVGVGPNTLVIYLGAVIGEQANLNFTVPATGLTPLGTGAKGAGVALSSFIAYVVTPAVTASSVASYAPTISYSAKSQTALVTFRGAGQKPKKPFIKMIHKRNQSAIVVWSGTADTTSYNIKRSTSASGPFTTVHSEPASSNDNGQSIEWSNTGLTNDTTYYYVVTSVNATGESDPSDVASVTPDIEMPTNLEATVQGLLSIRVSVDPVEGAIGYIFQKSTSESGPWDSSPQEPVPTYTWNGLLTGTRYYFRAQAVASGGDTSPTTEPFSITTASGKSWFAGDAVFNTGRYDEVNESGTGFIDLYSTRSIKAQNQAGPTMVMNVRTGNNFNEWSEHAAIGNLSGLYGYTNSIYGVAVGKYSPITSWMAVDPENGVRIMTGDTQMAQWNSDGDIILGRNKNVHVTDEGLYLIAFDEGENIGNNAGISWRDRFNETTVGRMYVIEDQRPLWREAALAVTTESMPILLVANQWESDERAYFRVWGGNDSGESVITLQSHNIELVASTSVTVANSLRVGSTLFLEGSIDQQFSDTGRMVMGQTSELPRRYDFYFAGGSGSTQSVLFYGGDSGNGFKLGTFSVQATNISLLGAVTMTTPSVNGVTYQNSWTDFGSTFAGAGYWKDAYGVVHLRGRIKTTGALNTTAFTLPSGFRPTTTKIFAAIAGTSNSIGAIQVNTDGTVVPLSGSINAMSLDGMYFRTV